MESGADACFGFYCNIAIMLLDDGIAGGKPKAAAVLFGSKIGIEYLLQILFRYADTIIFDRYPQILLCLQRQHINRARHYVFGLYFDNASIGHRLLRIDNKIADNLIDLPLVYIYQPEIVRYRELTSDIRAPQNKSGRLFQLLRY